MGGAEAVEAVVVPPWDGQGPEPVVRVFGGRGRAPRPYLWVFVEGDWRPAVLAARQDYPGGVVVYQVEVTLPSTGTGAASICRYRFDRRSMRW